MQEPLKLDIVISFPDHGFHLRFDPLSQVLCIFFFSILLPMVFYFQIKVVVLFQLMLLFGNLRSGDF